MQSKMFNIERNNQLKKIKQQKQFTERYGYLGKRTQNPAGFKYFLIQKGQWSWTNLEFDTQTFLRT